MMINPGSSDIAGVFALLTAVSDPEAAKANLQEITDASTAYQKSLEDGREEMRQLHESIATTQAEVDGKLAEAIAISEKNAKEYTVRHKQLDDQEATLALKDVRLQQMGASLDRREADVKARESAVAARESAVTDREGTVQKLYDYATAMKDDYSAKMVSLQSMLGNKSYVLPAETGSFASNMMDSA